MIKRFAATLAAAAVACTLFTGCEQNQASVADLPRFESREAFTAFLKKPDANALIFVEAKDCQNCAAVESVIKQSAATRTDVKFYKVDATWTTVRSNEPFIAFIVPEVGITVTGNPESLTGARKMDRFINHRLAKVKDLLPLKQAMTAAETKYNEAFLTYDVRIDATRAKMRAAGPEHIAALETLRAEVAQISKPFDDEIAAIQIKKRTALAATNAKIEAARKLLADARLPFKAEISTIEIEQETGTAELAKAFAAAEKAFNDALANEGKALKKN